ncbi:MAG: fumarylacetoacetate hydrolase family protein [Pirellulales bacterium]|nr:fumarylacetoacetate hydrolase family protein [Pirellulales bacterium]
MRLHLAVVVAIVISVFIQGFAVAAEKEMTRYVRFQVGDSVAYGIVEGKQVRQLDGDLFGTWKPTDRTYPLDQVKLLVPSQPSKVLAVAGNYKSHLGSEQPSSHPELFLKAPSCLIANGESIVIPKGTKRVDHEAELVIVIGKRAKNVSKKEALNYVLGVTCGNDVSARDWQKKDVQWWRAKASDTFGPCGPFIVSGIDYGNLWLQARVNGEVKQKDHTSHMEHGVASVVSWASRHMTLEPGDLIYTGTPGKTTPLKPGDVVEIELEGVGVLRNKVK